MKVLCLTDFPVKPPDRWIWNHLDDVKDQADFLWAETSDRSGRLGKLVSRYPPFWRLALRALRQTGAHDYDLIVAWESKTGIPLALLRRLSGQTRTPFVILTFTPGEVARAFFPLIRHALGAVDHVTVLTHAEIEAYRRPFGLSGSKISLCLLGTYDLYPAGPPAARGGAASPYVPAAAVTHYGEATSRQVREAMYLQLYRSKVQFYRKFGGEGRATRFKRLLRLAYWPRWAVAAVSNRLTPSLSAQTRIYRRLLAELAEM